RSQEDHVSAADIVVSEGAAAYDPQRKRGLREELRQLIHPEELSRPRPANAENERSAQLGNHRIQVRIVRLNFEQRAEPRAYWTVVSHVQPRVGHLLPDERRIGERDDAVEPPLKQTPPKSRERRPPQRFAAA